MQNTTASESPLGVWDQTGEIIGNLPEGALVDEFTQTHTVDNSRLKIDVVETGMTDSIAVASVIGELNVGSSALHVVNVAVNSDEKPKGVTVGNMTGTYTNMGLTSVCIGGEEERKQSEKYTEKARARNEQRPLPHGLPPAKESSKQEPPSPSVMAQQVREISESRKGDVFGQIIHGNAVFGENVVVVTQGNRNTTGQEILGNATALGSTTIRVNHKPGTNTDTCGMRVKGNYNAAGTLTIDMGGQSDSADSDSDSE